MIPKTKKLARQSGRGFTLLELLIVIAISMVLLSVVIIQQRSWSESLAMSSQAYKLALTAREAQINSLAVKENRLGAPNSDRFDIGYGLWFDRSTPSSYVYFADLNGNKYYDGSSEDISRTEFKSGVTIDKITLGLSTGQCDLPSIRHRASVLYYRPTTRPYVCATFPCTVADYEPGVCVFLKSSSDHKMLLRVNSAGEITTEKY